MSRKHLRKRRNCLLRAFLLLLSFFKNLYCRHVKPRACLGTVYLVLKKKNLTLSRSNSNLILCNTMSKFKDLIGEAVVKDCGKKRITNFIVSATFKL